MSQISEFKNESMLDLKPLLKSTSKYQKQNNGKIVNNRVCEDQWLAELQNQLDLNSPSEVNTE